MSRPVDRDLVRRSVDLAWENVVAGGKPFACLVVDASAGEVLHEATNQVSRSGDVTEHAEVTAIRELAAAGRTDLAGRDDPGAGGRALRGRRPLHDAGDLLRRVRPATGARALPAEQGTAEDPVAPFREWTRRHG